MTKLEILGFTVAALGGGVPLIAQNGVAFTGEGKLVRKATGYEQES